MFLKVHKFIEEQASDLLHTPAQMFSYEFCKSFKDTYFVEHIRMAASEDSGVLYITKA